MDEFNLIIANNISSLRQAHGITQSELAEKLNYTDKLVSKWERGESVPNAFTLKQLGEIFGVSVDYLFTDHRSGEQKPSGRRRASRGIITAISICGIWAIAFFIFVVLWILDCTVPSIFVYTITVSLITLLVLNSIWNGGKHNYIIVSVLIASIVLSVYVALIKYNCWQIFLLILPADLIVLLCSRLKRA